MTHMYTAALSSLLEPDLLEQRCEDLLVVGDVHPSRHGGLLLVLEEGGLVELDLL